MSDEAKEAIIRARLNLFYNDRMSPDKKLDFLRAIKQKLQGVLNSKGLLNRHKHPSYLLEEQGALIDGAIADIERTGNVIDVHDLNNILRNSLEYGYD